MTSAIVKYAILSEFVYSRSSLDQAIDTTLVNESGESIKTSGFDSELSHSGFYAETWLVDGKYVIAFRGTDFADDFSKDNVQGLR